MQIYNGQGKNVIDKYFQNLATARDEDDVLESATIKKTPQNENASAPGGLRKGVVEHFVGTTLIEKGRKHIRYGIMCLLETGDTMILNNRIYLLHFSTSDVGILATKRINVPSDQRNRHSEKRVTRRSIRRA